MKLLYSHPISGEKLQYISKDFMALKNIFKDFLVPKIYMNLDIFRWFRSICLVNPALISPL